MPQPDQDQPAVDGPQTPSPEVLSKARDLIESVTLLDIRPSAISAKLEDGTTPGAHVSSVEIDLAISFAADKGVYGSRFDYSFHLHGHDQMLATVEFSLLLDYQVTSDFEPDVEAADFVTTTTGYFAAYPYARELFQSLAGRLQFDPVVLGLIRRDSLKPGSISVIAEEPAEE